MTGALETMGLGKQYGDLWALRDCTLTVPAGRVAALVGPNGAGKSTLLQLASGLNYPSAGVVRVFGRSPQQDSGMVLPRIGFLSQDRPLYDCRRGLKVEGMLTVGKKLNPRWDDALARRRLHHLGIPLKRKAGKLSGGQQAQVGLVLALAKRPELLLLDSRWPRWIRWRDASSCRSLMDAVAEGGLTVLLSSHILADLERVCDYLVILSAAHVQLAGDIDQIVARHKLMSGRPRHGADRSPRRTPSSSSVDSRPPIHAPGRDDQYRGRPGLAGRGRVSGRDRARLPRPGLNRNTSTRFAMDRAEQAGVATMLG